MINFVNINIYTFSSGRWVYRDYQIVKGTWNLGKSEVMSGQKEGARGFPGGAVVENPPANAGDTGSSPGLGGSHMPRSN